MIRLIVLCCLVLISAVGCSKETIPLDETISIRSFPGDIPAFKREYKAKLNKSVTVTITANIFMGSLTLHGELTQDDGKWVLFDPEDPADKILDRELLPLVEQRCKEILRIDEEYRASKPNEFVDESGTHWKRQGEN